MFVMRKGVDLALNKYTLYCNLGRLFRPGTHFLLIGEWLQWTPDRVILAHGVLSDSELKQIRTQTLLNVYQDSRYCTMSIVEPYADKYLQRNPDREKLTQYVGCLHRENYNLFTGRIRVK